MNFESPPQPKEDTPRGLKPKYSIAEASRKASLNGLAGKGSLMEAEAEEGVDEPGADGTTETDEADDGAGVGDDQGDVIDDAEELSEQDDGIVTDDESGEADTDEEDADAGATGDDIKEPEPVAEPADVPAEPAPTP